MNMNTPATVEIRTDHIRLCDLLKLAGLADSGAQGKQLVAQGLVSVDGVLENRKTAKIRQGQKVMLSVGDVQTTLLVARQSPA
jgi:ribosome-associated protein